MESSEFTYFAYKCRWCGNELLRERMIPCAEHCSSCHSHPHIHCGVCGGIIDASDMVRCEDCDTLKLEDCKECKFYQTKECPGCKLHPDRCACASRKAWQKKEAAFRRKLKKEGKTDAEIDEAVEQLIHDELIKIMDRVSDPKNQKWEPVLMPARYFRDHDDRLY